MCEGQPGMVCSDRIRAALMPGRGAGTSREKTVRGILGDVFKDFYILLQEPLFAAGIHTNKGRSISAIAEGFNTEAKAIMVPIGVHPIHFWVKTYKGNLINDPNLVQKVQNWKEWTYTDGSCQIQLGRQVIGAGVYHPDNDSPNFVQPNGAGITDTIVRAALALTTCKEMFRRGSQTLPEPLKITSFST
eukprot:406500-Pelagomonas_calceolata.AAC.1